LAPSGVQWINLQAKINSHANAGASSRKDEDLLIQHGDVDVSELAAALQADPNFCRESSQAGKNAKLGGRKGNMDQFKPGVDSVHLMFSDYDGGLVFKFPFFTKYESQLMPVLNAVMRGHFGIADPMQHVMRLQFACMNPHSKILKHTDRGGWVQHGHRIHVPLVVPAAAAASGDLNFVMVHEGRGDINVPLKEGAVFEINNAVPHRVSNDADTWRIHLLLDFAESPIPASNHYELEQGQECGYHSLDKCAQHMQGNKW